MRDVYGHDRKLIIGLLNKYRNIDVGQTYEGDKWKLRRLAKDRYFIVEKKSNLEFYATLVRYGRSKLWSIKKY